MLLLVVIIGLLLLAAFLLADSRGRDPFGWLLLVAAAVVFVVWR